jgi:hypothetical protein
MSEIPGRKPSKNQPAGPEAEFSMGGFYEPGFLHLRVNAGGNVNLNDITKVPAPEWVPNFLHEYIHFLQDITSTHGLLNFIKAIQHLKNANKQVLEAPQAEFHVPLAITNKYNHITNKRIGDACYGDRSHSTSIKYLNYRQKTEDIKTGSNELLSIEHYQVSYHDEGAHADTECHFGSWHIKEYMAHAVQRRFAPATSHDDIPYSLVELIVQKECPRLARDSALIIALCDASLMDYHPARLFFHTLERIKMNPEQSPESVDNVYEFAFTGQEHDDGVKTETVHSLFLARADQAVEEFRDALSGGIFKDNVAWFEELISEAKKLRLFHRGYMTKLVDSPGYLSKTFFQILKTLGIPFTTDTEFKGHFLAPEKLHALNILPYYPKIFQAIRGTYSGSKQCSMHFFCTADAINAITNDDCLHKPWARVHAAQLCPYAQIWKTWGLQDKIPIPASESRN